MAYATSSEPPHAHLGTEAPEAPDRDIDVGHGGGGRRPGPGDPHHGGRPEDGLALDLRQGDRLVELRLAGDLDLATAPRLTAAMTWLRRRWRRTIVVDTRRLRFIDLAGYRAFEASLNGPDGARDPRVVYVVGDVLARLLHHLSAVTGAMSPRLS
jgi:anti-anti-sigma factor